MDRSKTYSRSMNRLTWSADWMLRLIICSNSLVILKLFILLASNLGSSTGLKLIMLEVPSPSYVGESVELSCIYELESDKLYSVKWYELAQWLKHNNLYLFILSIFGNHSLIFHYLLTSTSIGTRMTSNSIGQFLPISGIRVDVSCILQLSKSGMNSVFLKYIDINTAGVYRCEVSAEAPSFVTEECEKQLQVTVLPTSGPQISGVRPEYRIGDKVNLNCTSARSKPAAKLRWYVNNREAKPEEYELSNATRVLHQDNLETSSLILRFMALDKHFRSGVIRVKCTATVVHTTSNEAILRGESTDKNIEYYQGENLSQSNGSATHHESSCDTFILVVLSSLVIHWLTY
ncbi:hypothetical protein BLOT_007318 [Blomia tropicalis]|nr:hypothetical protein BLOT_007318 [Blomia tropicalis]